MIYSTITKTSKAGTIAILGIVVILYTLFITTIEAKDHTRSRDQPQKGQNLCIARFESTGEPLYYTCPRANEPEKKSYCCHLDKCCDYKEFMKLTEHQFKVTQAAQYGYMSKNAIGGVLKVLLYIVLFVILLIVACCCLVFLMCRKKKLFSGTVFNTPLPAQPPGGVNIYQRPNQPYDMVESIGPPGAAAPGVPPPSYPAYPPYPSGPQQPPFNPNFK